MASLSIKHAINAAEAQKKVQYVRPGILSSSLIPVVVNQCHNQGAAALLCLVWTQGTLGCCYGFNNSHLSVCFRVMIVHNVDSSRPVTVDPLINLNWPRHDVPSTVSKYWAGGSSFSWGRRRRISPVVAWPWFVVDYHNTKTSWLLAYRCLGWIIRIGQRLPIEFFDNFFTLENGVRWEMKWNA